MRRRITISVLFWAGRDKLAEAVVNFERALELKQDYADAYNNLGFILAQKGHPEEAVSYYMKAIRFDPDHLKTYCNMGIALLALGRNREAALNFREALQLNPDDAELLRLLRDAESAEIQTEFKMSSEGSQNPGMTSE